MPFLETVLFAAAGALAGFLLRGAYERIPEPWLRDYDYVPGSLPPLPSPRLRSMPGGLLLVLAGALVFGLSALLHDGLSAASLACVLAFLPLSLLFVADVQTRILPDQLVVLSIPAAIPLLAADAATGGIRSLLVSLLVRLGAGLGAGLLLFLAGWAGSRILRRDEAMGMGDVKLVAACGFLTGFPGILTALMIAFLAAAALALPMLVRKYRRLARETDDDEGEGDAPGDTEASADEDGEPDDTLPFGPFLALGALADLLFHEPIRRLADAWLSLFLR